MISTFPIFVLFSVVCFVAGDEEVKETLPELKCISCDSSKDGEVCARNPILMDYCKSTSGFCYSSTWKGVLRRGCVGDNVVENVPRCEEDEDNCSICSDKNLCNDLKVEKKKCHRLDGRTRDLIDCPYSMRSSGLLNGCYHVVNETTHEVKKGCLNSLSIEEKVKLFANSREYKMCYTSGCNSKDYFPKCMECTDNSKKCLAPDVIGSKRYCSKLTDICMTSVKNGYVERRCADSIDMASYCEPEDPKCDTCSDGVLCNIRAVVNTCKRCDSISQCKEYNNPIQPCSLKYAGHSNFSECYVKIEKDQVTAKGCFNDLTKADQDKCRKGDDDCQICSGTNCNSKSKFKQECYSCDGSKDSKCANSGNETTIQCPNYSSSCFVGVDAKGITHRGCSSNEDDDKKYTREYELCYKDKCNDYPSPHNQLHCYQCDGDENCENIFIADDTTSIASTACANNNKNENKCFAYVTNEGKVVRGCWSDTKGRSECEKNKKKCRTCTGQECNNFYKQDINSSVSLKVCAITLILPIYSLIKNVMRL